MPRFLVERYLPGTSLDDLEAAVRRTARVLEVPGKAAPMVRHLSCTFIPSEESALCVFEGPSQESVEESNRRAGFHFDHVIDVTQIDCEVTGPRAENPVDSPTSSQGPQESPSH